MKSMQDIVEDKQSRKAAFDVKHTMKNGLDWCRGKAARIIGVAAVIVFVLALAGVGVFTGANEDGASVLAETDSVFEGSLYHRSAGVASVLDEYEIAYADQMESLVIEGQDVTLVGSMYADASDKEDADSADAEGSAAKSTDDSDDGEDGAAESKDNTDDSDEGKDSAAKSADEDTETAGTETENADTETEDSEEELTDAEKEWQQYLMAVVEEDEYLPVYTEASEDSEVVGKLYKSDRAVIEETSGDWTKISSGSVVGYVLTENCVTGTDALKYMQENCTLVATVISNKSLRIRKAPSTSSGILKMVSKGTVLTVDRDAETEDGWVAVLVDGTTYYVCADYVELAFEIGEAISIEEEKAAEEAAKAEEEAAKAAEEAAAKAAEEAAANASSGTAYDYDISDEELRLFAALIQCEAGGESYTCQVAVAEVVMNRVASGSFPNTITDVIYQSGQFGPVSNGSLAKRLSKTVSSTAYKAAEEALAGSNYTNGCLYFNDIGHTSHSGLQIGAMMFW